MDYVHAGEDRGASFFARYSIVGDENNLVLLRNSANLTTSIVLAPKQSSTSASSLHRSLRFVFKIADLQQEHQREMEGLLENVRQLSQELKLHMLIIDQFIPPEFQVRDHSWNFKSLTLRSSVLIQF